jgi:hypothetical protein
MRSRAWPSVSVSPGLTPSRSASAGAMAISRPVGRVASAPGARRKRPTIGQAASVARRSTSAGAPPALAMPRKDTVSDTRPIRAKAASSSTVARRCETLNSTSPPRICRASISSAAIMLAARLPIPARPAVPRNRQIASSASPRPPRRRSRSASRHTIVMRRVAPRRSGRRRVRSPARSGRPARDHA